MLGAGLLAKNAVDKGLTVAPYIKTSLSPGSGVVTYYLKESGVIPYLNKLGWVFKVCNFCLFNFFVMLNRPLQFVKIVFTADFARYSYFFIPIHLIMYIFCMSL